MKKLISYIFPIYNESGNIAKLYAEMMAEMAKNQDKYDFEIICINDGSKDDSLEKLIELHTTDNRIRIINFSRNFGHQLAVTAGLDYAKGDAVIIMDADLQDPPSVSTELIAKWEEGYDVVYAQRRTRQDTPFKKFTAHIFYRVLDRFADIEIPKDTGDFRLIDHKVVEEIKKFRERNRFLRGMVSYVGFKQVAHQFDRQERFAGTTNYPLRKMVKLALDGITSFSTLPLRLITQFGGLLVMIGFLGTVILLGLRFFSDVVVTGWVILVPVLVFLGGIQMLTLGVIGEYVGRIYQESQDRPLYIVRDIY